MKLKWLCFFALLSASQASDEDEDQYISIIAPAVTSHLPYSVYLSTSEFERNTDLVVSFRNEDWFFKIKQGQATRQTQLVTFKNASSKPYIRKEKNYDGQIGFPLKLLARQNGKCIDKEIVILDAPREYHTFIQLDKPVYKPNDKIQYRVFLLDHYTKPVGINNIIVEFRDSEGNIVERQTELQHQKYKIEGIFEDTFVLSDNINLGYWTVTAKINNALKIIAEKKFLVDKVKLPFFELVIEANDKVYLDDKTIDLKVFGKYAFGEYIKGDAMINVTNKKSGESLCEKNIKLSDVHMVKISILNDLLIRHVPGGELDLTISVNLLDKVTRKIQKVQKNITLYSRRKHSIEIRSYNTLKDGLGYEFSVIINDPDGNRKADNHEHVQLRYIMKLKNGIYKTETKLGSTSNGVAVFKIPAYYNIEELNIKIRFLYDEIEKTIKPDTTETYALRVSVSSQLIGNEKKDLEVTVEYKELYEIIVLAIGRMGIVYSTTYDCDGDDICVVQLDNIHKFYNDLKPEAKIVVYSITHYSIISGSAIFRFQDFNENQVKIEVPTKGIPKQAVNITYTSKQDAIVSILAIDKKLTFLANGHDITREDVINALTNTKKLAYSKNEAKDVMFDEENNNFIINLQLNIWRRCTDNETKLLLSIDKKDVSTNSLNGGTLITNDRDEKIYDIPKEESIPSNNNKFDVRKHFPETWIWETNKITAGDSLQMNARIPDSMTTWLFTGISIHKDYGLAIAKPQELVVSKEFFIELNLPYSIKFGEIFQLEVIAFNYVRETSNNFLEAKISIKSQQQDGKQQFRFMNFTKIDTNCETVGLPYMNQIKKIIIPEKSGAREKFLIKPLINGKIEIRIEAEALLIKDGKKLTFFDKIVKELKVENEGVTYFVPNNFEYKLDTMSGPKIYNENFDNATIPNEVVEFSAVISGDMMGPALNFSDGLFVLPSGCGEQTMAKYAKTLWNFIYLKKTGKINSDQENTIRTGLNKGYQNMMKYKKRDNSFAVFSDEQGSTWMSAYTSRILGMAMQFGIEPIDKEIISGALKFCVGMQNSDGSFKETNNNCLPNSYNELQSSKSARFTAFVLLALLKNRDYVNVSYTDVIDKAFTFIRNEIHIDNYAAAIGVYAAVLANKTEMIDSLFLTLQKSSETNGDTRYWNILKGNETSESTNVLISAYTAMAYIENGKINTAKPIIRWLMSKRNPSGEFIDSHSTAVGLEALALMASKTGTSDTKIHFEFLNNKNQKEEYVLNNTNALKPQLIKMPKHTLNVKITGKGKGYGFISTYYEYYKNVKEVSHTFDISVTPKFVDSDTRNIKACVIRKIPKKNSPVVIIEFNLPSGYVYESRLDSMSQNSHIRDIEISRGGTLAIFYFDEIPFQESQCVEILAKKGFKIIEEKKASVKVYEYNDRDKTFASSFYQIEEQSCI